MRRLFLVFLLGFGVSGAVRAEERDIVLQVDQFEASHPGERIYVVFHAVNGELRQRRNAVAADIREETHRQAVLYQAIRASWILYDADDRRYGWRDAARSSESLERDFRARLHQLREASWVTAQSEYVAPRGAAATPLATVRLPYRKLLAQAGFTPGEEMNLQIDVYRKRWLWNKELVATTTARIGGYQNNGGVFDLHDDRGDIRVRGRFELAPVSCSANTAE